MISDIVKTGFEKTGPGGSSRQLVCVMRISRNRSLESLTHSMRLFPATFISTISPTG